MISYFFFVVKGIGRCVIVVGVEGRRPPSQYSQRQLPPLHKLLKDVLTWTRDNYWPRVILLRCFVPLPQLPATLRTALARRALLAIRRWHWLQLPLIKNISKYFLFFPISPSDAF